MVLQITLDEAKHYVARAHYLTTTQVAVEIPRRTDIDISNSFLVEPKVPCDPDFSRGGGLWLERSRRRR
jgi:hypothetical protein